MEQKAKLCKLCAGINIVELGQNRSWLPHHDSFHALDTAANSGCSLCALFLWSTLNHYSDVESSVRSPERYLSPQQHLYFYGPAADSPIGHWDSDSTTKRAGWDASKVLDYHRCVDINGGPGFRVVLSTVTQAQEVYGRGDDKIEVWNGLHYLRLDAADEVVDSGSIMDMPDGLLPNFSAGFRRVAPWVSMSALSGDTGNILGRTPSPTLDVDLCRQWLLECTTSHPSCRRPAGDYLPTRVLEVIGDTLAETVRLIEVAPRGLSGQYVALSYCWGSSRPFATTSETYHSHLAGIPLRDMPFLYQDAITVCRMLGIRYLWIDALCIIQGDKVDWQKECASMDRVYEEALFTINVPAATDPNHPFLLPRQSAPHDPCTLEVNWPSEGSRGKVSLATIHSARIAFAREESDGPLDTRAWITQEYLLSPRVLSFSSVHMYFTCNQGIYFENMTQQTSQLEYLDVMTPPHEPKLPKDILARSGQDKHTLWYTLVSQYSGKLLTHGSDRLPALSGLARRFAKELPGDAYVAGLWRDDLLNGLVWTTHPIRDRNPGRLDREPSSSPSRTTAPSWSWISCDQRIRFEKQHNATDDPTLKWLSSIRSIHTHPVGFDAFGEVSDGELEIQGPFTIKKKGHEMFGHPQELSHTTSKPWYDLEAYCLILGINVDKRKEFGIFGLLLDRVDGSDNVFRRVGLYREFTREVEDAYAASDALERRAIVII